MAPLFRSLESLSVLVVDDEPSVCDLLVFFCEDLGIATVARASGGADALAAIAAHPEIDVLITDIRMPGMDGPALAAQALVALPHLRILYVSGYADDGATAEWPVLTKPTSPERLGEALLALTAA